jgi:PQQ-dependent dehydrogenase (methanol/ethanol family)
MTYHGTYESWHYSPLTQINTDNVKRLRVAWVHHPGKSTRGLQSMPLVSNGVLYYTGSYSRVWALEAATGKPLWSFFPKLNDDLVAAQTHSPYTRGIAIGHGKVFVGTVDGRLIAIDQKTGQSVWDTKLINSEKLTVGFTGAPLLVKDKVIIGSQGGEWPGRGPIFGVDANSGKKLWEFLTVAGTEDSKKTWGNDSWRTGGGGGWMAGGYDAETNTVWWGTGNPAPLYDWAGFEWKTSGPRPGDNLFTTSVIALNPDTGALKFYHQELPHDAWDFDSAVGEFVMIDRDGKKLVVHPNKGGHVFVYDRKDAKIVNVWQLVQNINFVKGIDPKTGALIGRRDLPLGKHTNLCPGHRGRHELELRSLQPEDGPLLQDRPGMVHGSRSHQDDADPRAAGAARHRRQLHASQSGGRQGAWSPVRARSGDRTEEMGSEVHRAAAGQPAGHGWQPRLRPRRARLSPRLQRGDGTGALVTQQRHRA